MKTFKKAASLIAATAAAALSLTSASLTAFADTQLEYNGTSESAYSVDNDGVSYRVNLLNEWTKPKTSDMPANQNILERVDIDFTISGLKNSYNVNEKGEKTSDFMAWAAGSIGGSAFWSPTSTDNTVENPTTTITGDGSYTVSFLVPNGSASIECLILQTNINIYSNGVENPTPTNCGITCTIDAIRTADDPNASYSGDQTTANDNSSTDAATTTEAANNSSSSNNSSSNSSSSNSSSSNSSSSNKTTTTTAAASSAATTTTTATTAAADSKATTVADAAVATETASAEVAEVSATGDTTVMAIVFGAVATSALGAAALTMTKKRK